MRTKKRKAAKELQNQFQMDAYFKRGGVKLGPWSSHIYRSDPRHLGFLLARYKFCAKMLAGKRCVLEAGCGDALGIPLVLQTVDFVHGVDFEPLVLEDATLRLKREGIKGWRLQVLDLTQKRVPGKFDAAYSLDVIEHIPAEREGRFMKNLCVSLTAHAVCIIGTPNLHASSHATPASAEGHVNLKSADSLRELMSGYFHNVFIFSMNDEMVHTGYYPMAHYLMGMGAGVKK